jgi:small subunit ribosomal protein S1
MQEAEKKKDYSQIIKLLPKINELVEGTVIEIGRNEIYLDIKGVATGIVRGIELLDESGDFSNLKKGDKISATVIELENEKGLIELSFRSASHKKIWNKLEKIAQKGEKIKVKVTAANKGGLLIKYGKTKGFLPVSQLSNENYPRVEGGDKNKILEKLKKFIGQELDVKIINTDEKNNTLIVSEKKADQKSLKEITDKYKVGDVVTGTISGLVDFGAFITFDQGREGLIHISELAWRRIDHPQDVVKVGEKVKAEIIDITEQGKISLSIKKITKDPWLNINKKYKLGQKVKGKVLKVNPFGLFVELDPLIHGLAHISELSDQPIKNISEFAQPGDVLEFSIVSIEPKNHRLGLSLKK